MELLRQHQEKAAAELLEIVARTGFGYLAGEVRSGKTRTALSVCASINAEPVLWVTKKVAMASIAKDAEAMDMADRVVIINYESIHKIDMGLWGAMVVDEAHRIGMYPRPSVWLTQLKKLQYQSLILLSGTPSPENFSQLYHQFSLFNSALNPWIKYRNFYAWAKDYVDIREIYVGQAMPKKDYSRAIAEKVLPDFEKFKVSMTQADAGITMPVVEKVHYVTMKPATYVLANAIKRDGVATSLGWSVVADTGAKQLSKLRQIWSGTLITEGGFPVIVDRSKGDYIIETFRGGKLAILYTFKAEYAMLHSCMQAAGITPTASPEEFNSTGPSCWYVGQVASSREGVNLSAATDLVFLGIDFSALSYLQGRDRASHIDRRDENRVHWILAADSLEIDVFARVKAKERYTVAHFKKRNRA
jgi:hypothetical protein